MCILVSYSTVLNIINPSVSPADEFISQAAGRICAGLLVEMVVGAKWIRSKSGCTGELYVLNPIPHRMRTYISYIQITGPTKDWESLKISHSSWLIFSCEQWSPNGRTLKEKNTSTRVRKHASELRKESSGHGSRQWRFHECPLPWSEICMDENRTV